MRAFYVIGHNTNSIENVREVLKAGANAVEPDIQFDPATDKLLVTHDDINPLTNPAAGKPRLQDFFLELREIALEPSRQLAMVMLDSKHGNAAHGGRMLRYAREALTDTGVSLVLSVSDLSKSTLFDDIVSQMGPREALMVDQDHKPNKVVGWFNARGIARAAFGDDHLSPELDQAVALKVQHYSLRWVYVYTIDNSDQMRDAIRSGLDGIIVPDARIETMVKIVNEPEFKGLIRLAKPGEDPFDGAGSAAGYTITIETLDRGGAGTDANVTFRLLGEKGTLHTTVSGGVERRFERGNLNEVSIYGDIGLPVTLSIEHDGVGDAPDWLPDVVRVSKTGEPRVFCAGMGDWIVAHKASTRRLGTTRYRLKVKTGVVEFAGTDADIVFTIHGQAGDVQRRVNGERPWLFERGRTDDVYLAGFDVGPVTGVSVFNDGTGENPDWFLDSIEVNKELDPPRFFTFDRWVRAGKTETA